MHVMLSFCGVCCHGHCTPWLWWEKKEMSMGMLSSLLQGSKRSKCELLIEAKEMRDTWEIRGRWLFTVLHVLLLILLFIASSSIIKKLGFVSSCRMALGDWLVWGTIKPLLFEKQNEPSEASVLWLVGAQMVIKKKSAIHEMKKSKKHSSVVGGRRWCRNYNKKKLTLSKMTFHLMIIEIIAQTTGAASYLHLINCQEATNHRLLLEPCILEHLPAAR